MPSLGDTEVVLHNCNIIERKTSDTVITINGYPIDGDESTFSDKDFIGIDNIQIYYADAVDDAERVVKTLDDKVDDMERAASHIDDNMDEAAERAARPEDVDGTKPKADEPDGTKPKADDPDAETRDYENHDNHSDNDGHENHEDTEEHGQHGEDDFDGDDTEDFHNENNGHDEDFYDNQHNNSSGDDSEHHYDEHSEFDNEEGYREIIYSRDSLVELNNTDNFLDSTIEHIFEGNIRRGNAQGYHYEGIEDTAGSIISGTEISLNDLGVYKAQVTVNGIPKTGNGGYSTFFPKDMSPQDVIDTINEAYNNRTFVLGSRNSYIGVSNNGLVIEMYINDDMIISAFPKE